MRKYKTIIICKKFEKFENSFKNVKYSTIKNQNYKKFENKKFDVWKS